MDKHCTVSLLRWFFGVAFVIMGVSKLFSFSMMQGFFSQVFGSLATVLLVVTIIAELGGGLLLLADKWTKHVSLVLMVVMVVAFFVTMKWEGNVLTILQSIVGSVPILYLVGLLGIYYGSK
ncbi:MAG TPA: DoxX family membrane protein [Candidatus Nanoarchaeia archaeon]|nr:DoxX family membrane protein [Candidatus Nanoarchaeia archaeon]